MRQHRLVLIYVLTLGLVVASLFLYRRQTEQEKDGHITSEMTAPESLPRMSGQRGGYDRSDNMSQDSAPAVERTVEPVSNPESLIPDSKKERIRNVYERLADQGIFQSNPHPEEIAILTEGMDSLSGAKYLNELGHFGYAFEYADRAWAENPESFEALMLRTQLLPEDRLNEQEPGFRQLLQMDPDSFEASLGLGLLIMGDRPLEAISYLEAAIRRNPSASGGYFGLGYAYERLGLYDNALTAYQEAYQNGGGPLIIFHIDAIKQGKPMIPPIELKSQGRYQEQSPEGTSLETGDLHAGNLLDYQRKSDH